MHQTFGHFKTFSIGVVRRCPLILFNRRSLFIQAKAKIRFPDVI
jgi:hypothetical protein